MFTPDPPEPVADPPDISWRDVSWAEGRPRATPRPRSRWRTLPRPGRIAKLTAAAAVVAAGGFAVLGEQMQLVSDNAVVTAALILIRSPIGGVVTVAAPAFGTMLATGDTIARIDNPRLSPRHLADLRAEAARLTAATAATAHRRDAVAAMRATLTRRADAHARLVAERLAADVASGEATLADHLARREQAGRDLARRRRLTAADGSTPADLERAQLAYDTAVSEADAQSGGLASLRVRQAAAGQGLFAEVGPNETSYARQRADDLTLTLAELDQSLATLAADTAAITARVAVELDDMARQGQAVLTVAGPRMVWRPLAQAGEQVAAGDPVAALVDCSPAELLATVSQDDLPRVWVGGAARVRLSGEAEDRPGRVAAVMGEAAMAGDARMAALPPPSRAASAMVLITLPPPRGQPEGGPLAGECLVGRTARAILPRRDTGRFLGLLARWF
jgi:multidrug resistance efflux pump